MIIYSKETVKNNIKMHTGLGGDALADEPHRWWLAVRRSGVAEGRGAGERAGAISAPVSGRSLVIFRSYSAIFGLFSVLFGG